ncbi:GNAT family N-acetyltransferase [Plantactinospora sp. S1510]|uniref:GNAT family N-acetyltransferase n=1 Tax=Plantactinospora alkalitolerans TaxID=2789879 RepID=A0ABS0GQA3_9ACTN|nr:GNAT family N-acetyltransferase [Plantactinospora alkalitolerans]MBF9128368.1 GNAT family N-acetyltransferase [Plantactinospora alkalitolerans]
MHQPQTHPPQAHSTQQAEFRVASFADLNARTLHDLLKLRVDVFVVEQECAYPELDGRDVEPGARHLWLSRNGLPIAYLRLLSDPDGVERIGRVAVARSDRGGGHAGRLMAEALTVVGHRTCVLEAQSYLVDFYARYGFTPSGPEYVEDGIPHVPMRRDPGH